MGNEALTLRGLSKYYTSGQSVVMGLNRVNLTFCTGEFVAITGESGSGKSTMAKVMAGILPYESGEMLLFGRPTSHYDSANWERYRSDSISFISQSYDILPGCSVLLNVVSALRLTGLDKAEAAVKAEEILREVELWDMKKRRAAKLSSGQKQRLSIARALAKPTPILIADEPTGNLDDENSVKVVELLAKAAKERLVVMITHEFADVADYATRHITLQDGAVSADEPLRFGNDAAPLPQRRETTPKGMSHYTARLQIGSRPMWSAVMLLFFALTAFAVFAFLGTFIVNLDDNFTRLYDRSAFRNGDMERIVVVRSDGEKLTDEDVTALLGVPHAKTVERYGYVADINYFYRENVDYFLHYHSGGNGFAEDGVVTETPTLENRSLFVETIPAVAEGTEFLTAGRLPENMYEAVAGDEKLLGQTIPVYIQDVKNWAITAYLKLDITIVGTTDVGAHLFFDEEMGRALSHFLYNRDAFVLPDYEMDAEDSFFYCQDIHDQLMNHYGKDSHYFYFEKGKGALGYLLACISDEGAVFRAYGGEVDELLLTPAGSHDHAMRQIVEVTPRNFDLLVEQGYNAQMCLTLENYAYVDDALETLRAMGYGALSPYQLGSGELDEEKAAERLQTLKVCLLALSAVVLLQIVVLRAMFSMETEEYRLLSNLGLRWKTARLSVLWQVIAFALGGELLAVLAIFLCSALGIERIVSILRYLPLHYSALTWAVHFAASLLTTAWIAHALRRTVYPVTGAGADLEMNEEVEA